MDSNLTSLKSQIENQKTELLTNEGAISVTKILESNQFQDIINGCREYRDRIFTPLITLLLFIKQVLCPDKSCKKVISEFVAEQSSKGLDNIPSTNTGPYSKARQRLPEETVQELVKVTGESASEKTNEGWKIYGREVKAFDGTTVKMADTVANQEVFPQHGNQKKGLDFLLHAC